MKIALINGSPKTVENSLTLQYIFYLEKHFPEHTFTVLNIGSFFNTIHPDMHYFKKSIETIKNSDSILWAFPVYFGMVPFSLKQFIETVSETNNTALFHNKPVASFSTSMHLFDDLAHDYLRGICEDWKMNYYGFFSADLYDFFSPEKMKDLIVFANFFIESSLQNEPCQKFFPEVKNTSLEYVPGKIFDKIPLHNKRLLVLEDNSPSSSNVKKMSSHFSFQFFDQVTTVQLQSLGFQVGCTGCLKCGESRICPLPDRSAFLALISQIEASDIIIFAGTVKDRFFSSLWKLFFDRSFFRGHPPNILKGKQIGFIVAGPFSQTNILNRFIVSFSEIEGANFAGVVSDESNCSETIDRQLKFLALKSLLFSEKSYLSPATSSGLGALKITRDNIYGRLSFVFREDYKYFKRSGFFDFPPTEKIRWYHSRLMYFLLRVPFFRKQFYSRQTSILPFLFKKRIK